MVSGSESKNNRESEETNDSEQSNKIALPGTTLRVYRFLYRSNSAAGIYDIQRGLDLSSPSVSQYHVKKFLRAGLIVEEGLKHKYRFDAVDLETLAEPKIRSGGLGTIIIAVLVLIIVVATLSATFFFYRSTTKMNDSAAVSFAPPWHFTENTTLIGQRAELVCDSLRLPCPSSPSFSAQEYNNGSAIAYAIFSNSYSQSMTVTSEEVVIINNSTYCVNPQVSWEPQCPATIK